MDDEWIGIGAIVGLLLGSVGFLALDSPWWLLIGPAVGLAIVLIFGPRRSVDDTQDHEHDSR